jgi:cytoskeleton protein RodZ
MRMPDDSTRDIGAHLREARERAGITLREIAAATKISMPALEALERNDVARLPGGIFVRAFVRAYAKEVGLDPDDAVRRFVARFPDAEVEEGRARYETNPDRIDVDEVPASGRLSRAIWWSLPIVLVIVYFGFGGSLSWWGERGQSLAPRPVVQAEPVPPGPATPILTTPAASPPPEPAAAATTGAPEVPAEPSPGTESRATSAPNPTDDSQAASREGRFQLTLTSRGLCWVTVRSNGVVTFTGTMKEGDRKDVDVWGRVSLTVGNAGVIDLAINGQRARPLGGEGQVVTALLNTENLNTFLETR